MVSDSFLIVIEVTFDHIREVYMPFALTIVVLPFRLWNFLSQTKLKRNFLHHPHTLGVHVGTFHGELISQGLINRNEIRQLINRPLPVTSWNDRCGHPSVDLYKFHPISQRAVHTSRKTILWIDSYLSFIFFLQVMKSCFYFFFLIKYNQIQTNYVMLELDTKNRKKELN